MFLFVQSWFKRSHSNFYIYFAYKNTFTDRNEKQKKTWIKQKKIWWKIMKVLDAQRETEIEWNESNGKTGAVLFRALKKAELGDWNF